MIDPTGKAGASTPPRVNPATIRTAPTAPVASAVAAGDARQSGPAADRAQSTIAAIVEQGPPIDSARVAAVKAAIADGSYRIDADRLARDIVAHGTSGSEAAE